MRPIDADALINDILTDYGCDPKYIADETIDGLKPYTDQLILERIGLQPTIAASPWHRVEDELPVKGEIVIVSDGKRTWDVGQYHCLVSSDDRTKWWWKGHTIKTVKWWMRKKDALPEPPQEDTK